MKTGLFLSNTVRDEARSLGKVNGSALLSVAVEALKVPTIQVVTSLMQCLLEEHVRGQGIIFNHLSRAVPRQCIITVYMSIQADFILLILLILGCCRCCGYG